MANEYFQPGSVPAPNAPGSSAVMRQEFASISAGFDKLPILAGHANELVSVNSTGTALVTSGSVVGDYLTKDGVATVTNKTIAWADNTFPGFGDAATRNAGKNAGQVLLLENNMQLPAIDGSLLTGLNAGMISGVVDITHGGTGANTLVGAQSALGIDLKADANNAVLTGAPTAPTPPTGDNSARIATTYFVTNTLADVGSFAPSNAAPLMDGEAASGTGALGSRDDHRHPTDTTRAPLNSPALTGTPTAPTAAAQTSTDQIATTAFVNAEIAADRPYSDTNPLMDGAAAQGSSPRVSRQDHVHPTDTTRAPLASPALTGVPTAPTPITQTNTTQIATTAFVQSLIAQQPSAGMQPSNSNPLMNGAVAPGTGVEGSRWDHVHPTDTSRAPTSAATAAGTSFTPSGNIAANNVQAAIQELDTEKAPVVAGVPSGAIMDFAMNSAPAGWLACNGAAVSRTTYAALFAAIGTTWGAGDGSTTFNLPDMRGYFRRGVGTNSDGTAAGEFAAKVVDSFKSHQHAGTTGGQSNDHNHGMGLAVTAGAAGNGIRADSGDGNNNNGTAWTRNASADHSHNFTTAASGSTETAPKNIAVLTCIKV